MVGFQLYFLVPVFVSLAPPAASTSAFRTYTITTSAIFRFLFCLEKIILQFEASDPYSVKGSSVMSGPRFTSNKGKATAFKPKMKTEWILYL